MYRQVSFLFSGLLLVITLVRAVMLVSATFAAQGADSDLLSLTNELDGAGAPGTIVVQPFGDSGATYSVMMPSSSGDLGTGIANETGKPTISETDTKTETEIGQAIAATDTAGFRSIVAEESFVPLPADSFALIPAGSFSMGDQLRILTISPEHMVGVSSFYMGKHEVTWSLWQAVRNWAQTSGLGYDLKGTGMGKAEDHPVQSVSWFDAVKWCNAASERAGLEPVYLVSRGGMAYRSGGRLPYIDYRAQGYRLPTEAEWEKAARGGLSRKRYPSGDSISHSDANYYESGYQSFYDDGSTPYTAPVGSFPDNGYGLYDMAGNVLEWCNDLYGHSYYKNSPDRDPTGMPSGSIHVLRGGSWCSLASDCRVAFRYLLPDNRYSYYGFRLAVSR